MNLQEVNEFYGPPVKIGPVAELQGEIDRAALDELADEGRGPMRLPAPIWDRKRAIWSLASTMTHVIDIMPMIFNHRVVLTPKNEFEHGRFGAPGKNPAGLDAAWCYPTFEAAVEAVNRWNFMTEDEPTGYLKRAL